MSDRLHRGLAALAVVLMALGVVVGEVRAAQVIKFDASAGGDKQLTGISFDNAAASGDTAAVAAGGTGKVNRIYRLFIVAASATNIIFKCGSTAQTGALALAANGSITLDFQAEPWFECADNAAFNINSSNAVSVTGRVWYTQG